MDSSIAESPAALAIRGIFALLFGIIALLLPVSAFLALVLVFGACHLRHLRLYKKKRYRFALALQLLQCL